MILGGTTCHWERNRQNNKHINMATGASAGGLAVERWKILKRAILAAGNKAKEERGPFIKHQEDANTLQTGASVRSFSTFELFSVTDTEFEDEGPDVLRQGARKCMWNRYSHTERSNIARGHRTNEEEGNKGEGPDVGVTSALIRFLPPSTSLEAMVGFNNTGNVCVWPSEEVLAHYCLENRDQFRDASVCEVGGGMSCLAGIMLALTGLPARVRLTDGNTASVENVRQIIEANRSCFGEVCVSADVLLWNEDCDHPKFDFVVCADCLFFVELHKHLSRVIHKLLRPGGRALLLNPQRGGTLDQFVGVANELFSVTTLEKYDELVWDKHCVALATSEMYRPDLHYPVFLVLEPLKCNAT